jgi:DNA-binding transcriptional ArsR family regulator
VLKQEGSLGSASKRIVDIFLSSETMADIVLLFRGNPQLIISEDHIASRVGKNLESIRNDLRKLVKLGILRIENSGGQNWFGFDVEKDRKIQRIIEAYIRDYKGNGRYMKTDGMG